MKKLSEKDFNDFVTIGIALGAEKDLYTLLELILSKGQEILNAEASTLFLSESETKHSQPNHLRFKLVKNNLVDAPFSEFTLPINDQSLAGYVAHHRCVLNIIDVYELDPNTPFGFNPSFDQKTGFKSQALLSAPLIDHLGHLVGVVQFWNKADDTHFTSRDELILKSLASQAAIAIENAQLYKDIQNLFEGFIKASVTAIEARDPTTSGHSERVAKLSVSLGEELHSIDSGPYKKILFSENDFKQIKYAALLHDFGKIGVRENLLVKSHKLFPYELDQINDRIDLYLREKELHVAHQKIQLLEQGVSKHAPQLTNLDIELEKCYQHANQMKQNLRHMNQPTVMTKEITASLGNISSLQFKRPDGTSQGLINPEQHIKLNITRGTLSESERKQIQEHVSHSFQFLQQIPWTRDLNRVSSIAYSHHEKLDGSGYPRGLTSENIPLEAKMMTIADIFDALVARDRPYKKAMPTEKALNILKMEASENKLDSELVNIFIHRNVYRAHT